MKFKQNSNFPLQTLKDNEQKQCKGKGHIDLCKEMTGALKNVFRRDVFLDGADALLQNNKLTKLYEVSVVRDSANTSGHTNTNILNGVECQLPKDLGHLWENTRFTDCSYSVRGQKSKACKSVLASPFHF